MDRGVWWATAHGVARVGQALVTKRQPFIWVFSSSWDFSDGSDSKASAYNAGDLGWIPGLGRSPGEGNGNLFQYSCLENPMDREAW